MYSRYFFALFLHSKKSLRPSDHRQRVVAGSNADGHRLCSDCRAVGFDRDRRQPRRCAVHEARGGVAVDVHRTGAPRASQLAVTLAPSIANPTGTSAPLLPTRGNCIPAVVFAGAFEHVAVLLTKVPACVTNEAFGNVTTSVPAAGDDAATSSGLRETNASPYATRWGYRAAALRRGPACQAGGAPVQCPSWLQTRQKEAARPIVARTLLVMLLLLVVCGGGGGLFNNNTARTARCERARVLHGMVQQYTARTAHYYMVLHGTTVQGTYMLYGTDQCTPPFPGRCKGLNRQARSQLVLKPAVVLCGEASLEAGGGGASRSQVYRGAAEGWCNIFSILAVVQQEEYVYILHITNACSGCRLHTTSGSLWFF